MIYSSPSLGFESTYRFGQQLATIQDLVDMEDDQFLESIANSNHFKKKCEANNLTLFDIDNIDIDDSNLEIRTEIVQPNERKRLLSQFTKLNKILSAYHLVPSTISHNNNLEGGGHIHLGYEKHAIQYLMSGGNEMHFVATMLLNLNNILNTYPSLRWAMNSPYDYINAKSTLYNAKFKIGVERLSQRGSDNVGVISRLLDGTFGLSSKQYALTCRELYKTFEFRFFTMPKDADGLKHNIDVAEKLYRIAFEHTIAKKTIKPRFTKKEQLMDITVRQAVKNLKECAKYLGIDYNEFVKHDREKSLRKRFQLEKIHNPNKILTQTYLN